MMTSTSRSRSVRAKPASRTDVAGQTRRPFDCAEVQTEPFTVEDGGGDARTPTSSCGPPVTALSSRRPTESSATSKTFSVSVSRPRRTIATTASSTRSAPVYSRKIGVVALMNSRPLFRPRQDSRLPCLSYSSASSSYVPTIRWVCSLTRGGFHELGRDTLRIRPSTVAISSSSTSSSSIRPPDSCST